MSARLKQKSINHFQMSAKYLGRGNSGIRRKSCHPIHEASLDTYTPLRTYPALNLMYKAKALQRGYIRRGDVTRLLTVHV